MIVTVTFNPSLDYIVTVPDFATGKTNRTSSELMLPGGKGINVSIVLSNLGVDATGDLLLNVLEYKPFLIKPNNHELGELFHVTLDTRESVVPFAKKLQELGARNVVVSMAGEGAVLVAEDGTVVLQEAPKGTLVNAVGAGDSMVAGFLAGWEEAAGTEGEVTAVHAFQMGVAAGSASAFSKYLATKEEILEVYRRMQEEGGRA